MQFNDVGRTDVGPTDGVSASRGVAGDLRSAISTVTTAARADGFSTLGDWVTRRREWSSLLGQRDRSARRNPTRVTVRFEWCRAGNVIFAGRATEPL